jgi:hypothetical protein
MWAVMTAVVITAHMQHTVTKAHHCGIHYRWEMGPHEKDLKQHTHKGAQHFPEERESFLTTASYVHIPQWKIKLIKRKTPSMMN